MRSTIKCYSSIYPGNELYEDGTDSGSDSIQKILDQLSEGKRIEGAFQLVTGFELKEVENFDKWEIFEQ